MFNQRLLTTACLALGLMLWAATTAQAQFDKVFGPKGTPESGTVVKMNKQEVGIDVGGRVVTFPVKDVRKITYADDPPELSNARDSAMQGQLEQALDEIKQINVGTITRQAVKEDVAYYKVYAEAKLALAGQREQAAASDQLFGFVRANPQSYHFYEAAELLGDLASAQSDWDKASAYYGSLAGSGWPEYQLRSNVLVAQSLVNKGDYKGAAARYDAVLSTPGNDPEMQRMRALATIGKAKCFAEVGQPDQAITMIETIIKENDPKDAELFARAYNALGDANRKLNKPEDALLAYLHTDVLFFSNSDAHAEALYRLVNLWTETKQNDRALQTRTLLKSRYANSRWATQQ